MLKLILAFIFFVILIPNTVFARVTPNDIYQEKRTSFEAQINQIKNPVKKDSILKADQELYDVNLKIANRFEVDAFKLASIMDEYKRRKAINETRVAYGNVNTPVEQADYWVNFAAEAVAYQKIQDYTPYGISETNMSEPINSSISRMKSDFSVLRGKILKAKSQVEGVLSSDK